MRRRNIAWSIKWCEMRTRNLRSDLLGFIIVLLRLITQSRIFDLGSGRWWILFISFSFISNGSSGGTCWYTESTTFIRRLPFNIILLSFGWNQGTSVSRVLCKPSPTIARNISASDFVNFAWQLSLKIYRYIELLDWAFSTLGCRYIWWQPLSSEAVWAPTRQLIFRTTLKSMKFLILWLRTTPSISTKDIRSSSFACFPLSPWRSALSFQIATRIKRDVIGNQSLLYIESVFLLEFFLLLRI